MPSAPAASHPERRESHSAWDKVVVRRVDAEIARLAADQHGVVATRQLSAIGLSRNAIAARAAAGRLHRIHRATSLARNETTHHHAIPVTTPARTLLDLAASLPRRGLERALDQAEVLELFDLSALRNVLDAHRGERGARALAAALEDHHAGTTVTRSALEEAFLALCAAHALERPQTNVRVCGLEVDFLFAARRLVVEADSWRFHRTRAAFERDRARDAILACAGYRTLRVTDRQLKRRPSEVVAAIAAAAPAPLRSSA